MQTEEILTVLKNSKFFRNLEDDSLRQVATLCRAVSFDAGDWVFKQGDYGEHLYIIVEGHIHLERAMTMGAREGHVIIDTLGKGRTLGCWSALLGEPHILMSGAVCEKPSLLLKIKGNDLRRMMTERIDFGFDVMERLCFLLRDRIQAAYGAMDRF
ncbi:MAG: cyclic nucleotide-binding domain-containing protein [Desulfosarcinaceae bacterium]|nr:cyclic nucleotide-binding domain-containing protein [Desulfosarcinaceae bacterium]